MNGFIELLQDKNSLISTTLNSLYDGVYVVDKERRIVFWNKAAFEITGYAAEDVTGHRCSENILNHIDENGILLCRNACPIVNVMKSGKSCSHKVYPKHKTGKRFPVETHISVIHDHNGEVIGSIEVFRDITHQEEFRILQEKFNGLIRKYVSNKTFSEIYSRLSSSTLTNEPHLTDLTVMYLDIVGFTGFSERHTPTQVVQMLNELFGVCEVITKECFGDIDKFIGDAVMAVFVDADDAIRSALKILNTGLPELNKLRLCNNEEAISIRIGINSGIVVQGDVGSSERMDLTVIGDTVNTAARIEKQAPQNRVLISEATLSRASKQTYDLFKHHAEIIVRGKTTPIKLLINI